MMGWSKLINVLMMPRGSVLTVGEGPHKYGMARKNTLEDGLELVGWSYVCPCEYVCMYVCILTRISQISPVKRPRGKDTVQAKTR